MSDSSHVKKSTKNKEEENEKKNEEKGNSKKIPYSLKDVNIVKLPKDDKIEIETILTEKDPVLEKYAEFLNNDNDIYYLESSFSEFYGQVV